MRSKHQTIFNENITIMKIRFKRFKNIFIKKIINKK